MFSWKRFHLILAMYGLLVSIGAFIAAVAIFLIPSEPGNSIFLGLSTQRWVLIIGIFLIGVIAASFSTKAYQNQVYAEQVWRLLFGRDVTSVEIRWGSLVVFILGWVASFTPLYRYGDFKDYFIRISPLINWLTFVGALTFVVSWVERYGFNLQRLFDVLRSQKRTLTIALIFMTIFALTWVLIAVTGLGLRVSEDYWYGAGVPILGVQILLAFVIGLCVLYLERSSINISTRSDLLIFALIWGLAAFLWIREPLQPSYFSPGPYPPDFEFHPYSDSVTFDIASQFALIGQGINNGLFFDRVLYIVFLVFLHAIAGQDYAQVVALQAAIYAVFPAILYLLGKAIHSRFFGVILAVLAILRGINGLAASNMIDLANQKQMLTDFPMAIFIAWFALVVIKWLKAPNKNYIHALWAGGIAGLAVMLRTHALFLLLFAVLLAIYVYWNQKLRSLVVSFLLVITMFASILPWGISSGGSVFDVYMVRIRNVIQGRYSAFLPDPTQTPALTPIATPASVMSATALPGANDQPPPADAAGEIRSTTLFNSLATHFLHNVVTSVVILPTFPVIHDLRYTLKEATPFWIQYWNGSMDVGTAFFLILNLLMIALGISTSWKQARLAGLIPLGIFIFYNMANAFARTSGGRYIVPVDWAVFLYFALGVLQVLLWGLTLFNFDIPKTTQDDDARTLWTWEPLKKRLWIVLIFLFVGASLPLSETVFSRRYQLQTQSELLTTLDEQGYLLEIGLDKATLQAASDQWPSFSIINGRAIYPRYFLENKGEAKRQYPYLTLGYPRIAFTVIGPLGTSNVILPEEQVPYFPNASDVIVIGCLESQGVNALAVVVIKEKTAIYVRQPSSPLQCPLQEPVCDENHVCR